MGYRTWRKHIMISHLLIRIYSLYDNLFHTLINVLMTGFEYAAKIFLVWMVLAIFVSELAWIDELWRTMLFYIFQPAENIFYYFQDAYKSIQHMDWDSINPIQSGYYLFKMIFCIMLALGLPVIFVGGWVVGFFITFWNIMVPDESKDVALSAMAGNGRSTVSNDFHMIATTHTSIQDTFDAEVQANAIADAISEKRK